MARIRYQPATKSKGFRPIQLSTAGISRMREETNRVVEGMQQNLAAEKEQQKRNLDAMRDDAAYTERITKENRTIEVQNLKNEQLSITQTADRDAQQAKYDADATQTILTSIVDFSETAAKKAAANTAKQLEDQTDAANAVPLAPLLVEDQGRYEEAYGTVQVGAKKQLTEDVIEGAESGETLDATYKKLASNAGLGAIGRRILANRLYEARHGIYTDRAFGSDEKIYEINGKKFSGLEALNDRQMTAVVQAQVTRDLARDMRETLGVTELLYFTKAKTATEKKDALQQERAGNRGIEQDQSMMLDNANVLLSNYTAFDASNAYSEIVVATNSYKTANTSMVNAIKMASTKEEAQAIRDAVITGQNGEATTWGQRYSKLADEAERDRVQRIDSDNNKAKLAQIRGVEERTLAAFNDGQIPEMIAENPFAAEKRLTELFASVGQPLPTYLKQEIANVSTGFNEDEIERYTRSGAEVPEELINRAKGTHQTKLKALNEAAQLRKFGGQLGKDTLSALDGAAKKEYNLGQDGSSTPDAVLLGAAFKARWMQIWKDKGFGNSEDPTTIAAEIAETNKALTDERVKDKTDPTGRFYSEPDAAGNNVAFPNLFPNTKDYHQLKTLVDKKFAAGRNIGEIASTPSLLAKPAELATLSQQSQISNNFRYPPLILYAAAKMKGKAKPSEIANEQIKANNLAYGENTPLIQPNIVTKAMDEASPKNAALMNSLYPSQRRQGFANHTGTVNRPENMRSTFRNTPSGQISGNGYGDTDGQDTGVNIELFGPQGLTGKTADHQSETGAYGGRGAPISFPYELTFNEFVPGGRNAGGRAITTQGSTDRVVKGTAPGGFGHIGSYTYTDEKGDQYEIMLAHGDQPFNAFNEGQTIPAGTVLGYQGASGSSDDGAGGGYDHISFHVNSYGNGDPNRIIRQFTESLINRN